MASLLRTLRAILTRKKVLFRIGRLIGVTLKEPFAEPVLVEAPSSFTHAYREWHLDRSRFETDSAKRTWQYSALGALRSESEPCQVTPYDAEDLVQFAEYLHHERGFFQCLGVSLKNYICGDPKVRKDVEKLSDRPRRKGFLKSVPRRLLVREEWLLAHISSPIFLFWVIWAPRDCGHRSDFVQNRRKCILQMARSKRWGRERAANIRCSKELHRARNSFKQLLSDDCAANRLTGGTQHEKNSPLPRVVKGRSIRTQSDALPALDKIDRTESRPASATNGTPKSSDRVDEL
jgi:hypothetical protein